jgi:hypothetical protein
MTKIQNSKHEILDTTHGKAGPSDFSYEIFHEKTGWSILSYEIFHEKGGLSIFSIEKFHQRNGIGQFYYRLLIEFAGYTLRII